MKRMFRTIALAAIAAAALTGCYKHEPVIRPDDGMPHDGGRDKDTENYVENLNGSISYLGRGTEFDESGKASVVERFRIEYAGSKSNYLFPLVFNADELPEKYDLADYVTPEVERMQRNVKADPDADLTQFGVFPSGRSEVSFALHLHGTWVAFLIELDNHLNPTYSYAESPFTIQQEDATEAFSYWEGAYRISDEYCAFDIVISSAENNYLYYVDGWETGPSIPEDSQMNMDWDWFFARFENGQLCFYAQFVSTDEYDGMEVDEVFAGTYLTTNSDKIGEVDDVGVTYEDNLAVMVEEEDGLVLKPWRIDFDNGYSMTYKSMRYTRLWYTDDGATLNWAFYNTSGVPSLPARVTRIAETRSTDHTMNVSDHSAGSLHRNQLKQVGASYPRKWKKN